MNYQKLYDQLVSNAKNRTIEGYTEQHRILPGCMGGTYEANNVVRLTAREHYMAHQLLFKIHRSAKLANAWFCMLQVGRGQERNFTSYQYEQARKAHSDKMKISMKGAGNHFYGRKHTEETKRKIGEANRGESRSPEQVQIWIDTIAKMPKSKEHRAKIGRKGFVMLKNINTGECVRVDKETAKSYNSNIWKNPAAISQKRDTCIYCDWESTSSSIKRWHNENCKHNPNR